MSHPVSAHLSAMIDAVRRRGRHAVLDQWLADVLFIPGFTRRRDEHRVISALTRRGGTVSLAQGRRRSSR